jgi:MFS family permease
MQPPLRTRPRARTGITFAVLAVSASSFSLVQSMIVPVLPTLQAEFATSQTTVTWVLTAYLLSASICTPLLGRIGDVVGKSRMLVAALVVLSVGSLVATLAPSIGCLLAARVLQGAGGGVLPLSFGIIRDEFQERRALALSVIASLTAASFGVGIAVAGLVLDAFGYRGLFWLPMAVTLVAAIAALAFVPDSPVRTAAGLPVAPALLLAGWLVAVLLGLSQGNTWGWTSPRVLGLFSLGSTLAVAWVVVEQRVPVPMIDMQMMRRRGVWTSNVVAWATGFSIFAAFGFLPQLLQTPQEAGYGFDATVSESGRLLLPWAVASFCVGFFTSILVRRFGARMVITAGLLLGASALVAIALFHDRGWQLYASTTVQGIGSGLVFSSLAGVVVGSVAPEQTGVANGMNANIRTLGGAVGTAVMAGILTSHLGPGGYPAERGYEVGFLLLGTVLALAALAALRIPYIREAKTGSTLADAADGELGLVAGAAAPGA